MLNISLSVSQPFEIALLRIVCLDVYPNVNWIIWFVGIHLLGSFFFLSFNSQISGLYFHFETYPNNGVWLSHFLQLYLYSFTILVI